VTRQANLKAADIQRSGAGIEFPCRASAAGRSRPNATASGPLVLHAHIAADHAPTCSRASPGLGLGA
jgi:hypothetical protein